MDELDLRILKEIGRDHILGWGSLDPRLTAAEIGDRVGVARSTVGARLRSWEASGFLVGFVALPHAGLLGARLGIMSVFVPDPVKRRRAVEDLSLMDGLFGALEHQGGWLGVGLIWESDEALQRRMRVLHRLPGLEEAMPFEEWILPRCTVTPSPLDWRILLALMNAPRAPVHALAEDAGVSVRTFRRRYQRLVAENAVWLAPALDFSRWEGPPLARLILTLEKDATGRAFDAHFTKSHPQRMYINEPPPMGESDGTLRVDVMVPLPAAPALDDLVVEVSGLDGVAHVEGLFLRRSYIFPQWFRERTRERLK